MSAPRKGTGSAEGRRVLYLAVVPGYRSECIKALRAMMPDVRIVCSEAHLDPSVKTGIPPETWQRAKMHRLFGRFFIQTGYWGLALRADDLIVDLNPRSGTAWLLLTIRRVLHRRTLVWGHIHPQNGAAARTRGLRHAMRRLSNGAIAYTYADQRAARQELPRDPAWVAPNALYSTSQLSEIRDRDQTRSDAVYVGRFEPAKKLDLLLNAFSASRLAERGARLVLVGGGSLEGHLRDRAKQLGIESSVIFPGWISAFQELEEVYARAFVSNSPGFAGLGLTQSLGFGVPMIVSTSEPHSPEIELASNGGVHWVDADSTAEYAHRLTEAFGSKCDLPVSSLQADILARYSAEAMAAGLATALRGLQEEPS